MPCARANASGRPGSGGRHQQVGGPAGCGQSARLDRPGDLGREARSGLVQRVGRLPSGLQSKTRCGASRSLGSRAPSRTRRARRRRRRRPVRPGRGARTNGTCSTPAKPSSVDGGSSSRNARICEVGASKPGSSFASVRSSPGVGSGAEAVEQPLDEVDLRLGERRVEPDAARRSPCRPAASIT